MAGLPIVMKPIGAGAVEIGRVDLRKCLDEGETATAVSPLTELETDDLTLDQEAVSGAELEIGDDVVPVGKAFTFRIAGPVSGTNYRIEVRVTTSLGRQPTYELQIPCK